MNSLLLRAKSFLSTTFSNKVMHGREIAICVAIFLLFGKSMAIADIFIYGSVSPANASNWDSTTVGHIGKPYDGKVIVDGGSALTSKTAYLGPYDFPSPTGTVTVTGEGTTWMNSNDIYVGSLVYMLLNNETVVNRGELTVSDGGQVTTGALFAPISSLFDNGTITARGGVLDANIVIDQASRNHPKLTFGTSGTLNLNLDGTQVLGVGYIGNGTLNISGGVEVTSPYGQLGYHLSSKGTATVSGAGSKWINNSSLTLGDLGSGTLYIKSGGEVYDVDGVLGKNYLHFQPNFNECSSGLAEISGAGSKWINSGRLIVGSGGSGWLSIVDGGLVTAKRVTLAQGSVSFGTCVLRGGTLRAETIDRGSGNATFYWEAGTIANLDANTNLNVASNLELQLVGYPFQKHTFSIDSGRSGTINAVISATGGIDKSGGGSLILTAANTFTDGTSITAGTLALSSTGSLACSFIDVSSGATFDVSAKSLGYNVGTGKTLRGSGTIIGNLTINGVHSPGGEDIDGLSSQTVNPGIETVKGNYGLLGQLNLDLFGPVVGKEYDQVLLPINGTAAYNVSLGGKLLLTWTYFLGGFHGSTNSTQLWIIENDTAGALSGNFSNYANGASLGNYDGREWRIYYGADAANGNLSGGNDVVIAAVPEPGMLVLLGAGILGMAGLGMRKRWAR